MSSNKKSVLIIGGGAAGYFAALTAAEKSAKLKIVIAEASSRPLQKVAISGGGRCNVTHACYDAAQLVKAYPRGNKELRGPFSRFQPKDIIQWFNSRGVKLKTEDDGRIFPVSDSSQTIISCFEDNRRKLDIDLRLKTKVTNLIKSDSAKLIASVKSKDKTYSEDFDSVILASGGSSAGYKLAKSTGHTLTPCVPSLFTFTVKDKRLVELSGISVENAEIILNIDGAKPFSDQGPLLVTHWGFSGPAIIRLSAWAAKELYDSNYKARLRINWSTKDSIENFREKLVNTRQEHPKRLVHNYPLIQIPKRLWKNLCIASGISETMTFASLSSKNSESLAKELFDADYRMTSKGVFKEEFVTCGGVSLKEVDFRTMQSKLIPGLYFAGEILDIDGITGGYNFQNAWTTGFIAGNSISL